VTVLKENEIQRFKTTKSLDNTSPSSNWESQGNNVTAMWYGKRRGTWVRAEKKHTWSRYVRGRTANIRKGGRSRTKDVDDQKATKKEILTGSHESTPEKRGKINFEG